MRPTRLTTKFPLTAAAFGFALGAAVLAAPAPARAADDEALDSKILRNLLEGIGLRKEGEGGINYQERPPLVIPPRLDLPPPETAAAKNNPAWPDDPDLKRAKQAAATERQRAYAGSDQFYWDSRPLRPDQMTPGADPRNPARPRSGGPVSDPDSVGKRLMPSELGYKGGLFGKLFGSKDGEIANFTGEPPRNALTDPPPGYQTPSPDQPYGAGKAPPPKPVSLEDRAISAK